MPITSIDIDREKLDEVIRLTNSRSAREAVNRALDVTIATLSFDSASLAASIDAQLGQAMVDLADR